MENLFLMVSRLKHHVFDVCAHDRHIAAFLTAASRQAGSVAKICPFSAFSIIFSTFTELQCMETVITLKCASECRCCQMELF